jgi:hypothetical protein
MLCLPMLLLAALLGPLCTQASHLQVSCDIVIAGGSTSALAAAFGAAEASPTASICITEPTDWLGGQMSSSGVSAIDFGAPCFPLNILPVSCIFQAHTTAIRSTSRLASSSSPRPSSTANAGFPSIYLLISLIAPQVSTRCYLANWFAEEWVPSHLGGHPNVRVFFRTVTTGVTRDPHTGAYHLEMQHVIEARGQGQLSRSRVCNARLSTQTTNGPSCSAKTCLTGTLPTTLIGLTVALPHNSIISASSFSKQQINFTAPVFIEAEEFGDVLVIGLSGLPVVLSLTRIQET